jgi:hypothetical protein
MEKTARIVIFIVILFFGLNTSKSMGQQIATTNYPYLLSSAGQSYTNGELALDWSLGEIAVETISNYNFILSQGFHQPTFYLTSSSIPQNPEVVFNVYPNPTNDIINIDIKLKSPERAILTLATINGGFIESRTITDMDFSENFSLDQLPAGIYILKILIPSSMSNQVFKIQKIN